MNETVLMLNLVPMIAVLLRILVSSFSGPRKVRK